MRKWLMRCHILLKKERNQKKKNYTSTKKNDARGTGSVGKEDGGINNDGERQQTSIYEQTQGSQ